MPLIVYTWCVLCNNNSEQKGWEIKETAQTNIKCNDTKLLKKIHKHPYTQTDM